MKKILLLLLVLTIASTAFAQDMSISAGGRAGISFYDFHMTNGGVDQGWNLMNVVFGAYFDATYVRLNVDYAMALSGNAYVGPLTAAFTDVNVGYLNLTLLGKFPFDLGGVKLWPALGARYALVLNYTLNGTNFLSAADADLSDFYIVGGAGVDIELGQIVITIQAIYCYNLTANPGTTALPAGTTVAGSDIEISTGIGFKF